jgi:hypothetical protein
LAASDVRAHLDESGVAVHHTARMPTPRDGRQVVVVFLDGERNQADLARDSAKRLPGVLKVVFSGYNRAVMYVIGAPVHPATPEPAAGP